MTASKRRGGPPGLTYEERKARGIKRAAATRSKNTRRRSLDEVRAAVHGAAIQMNSYARHHGREDIKVLSGLLGYLERCLTEKPATGPELWDRVKDHVDREVRELRRPEPERDVRWICVHVDEHGLRELQEAIAERLRVVRTLEAVGMRTPQPRPLPPTGVDFASARVRLPDERRGKGE